MYVCMYYMHFNKQNNAKTVFLKHLKGPGRESANQHQTQNENKKFTNYKSAVYSNNTSLTTAKSHDIVGNSPKSI